MSNAHELSRKNVKKLSFPGPLAENQVFDNAQLLLNNNTNAFGGTFKHYPDLHQRSIKQHYLDFIWKLDQKTQSLPIKDNPLNFRNILFSTGAVDALDLVFKAFAEPNLDEVILTPPTFSAFIHWAQLYRIHPVLFDLELDGAQLPITKIINHKAKLLLLCDPNNPLGSRINPENIINILDKFSNLIIIDEAYVEFSKKPSYLNKILEYPNLIILRTCSKALGMASLRVGALIANEKIIDTLKRVQPPYNMPGPIENMLQQQLNHPELLHHGIEQIRQERIRVIDAIKNSPLIKKIYSSETNFICIEFTDAHTIIDRFNDANIKVLWRPEELHNTARITLGNKNENNRVINVLTHRCRPGTDARIQATRT